MKNEKKKIDPRELESPKTDTESGGHYDIPSWRVLPNGGVVTAAGNARDYDTGNWTRTTTRWKKEICINCNLCWVVCPHDAIQNDAEGNMVGVDEDKCTNCGLCIVACPTKPEKSLFEERKEDKKI